MKSLAFLLAAALLGLSLSSDACADLIPTPDFSDHAIPTGLVPDPHASVWAVVDMIALAGALCLSTYFALVSRSRNHLLILTVASLAYFGFFRGGCVCPIGATQNVALAVASPSYVVPIGVVVFFTLPLVFTLFFGRTFCAAVCPLGAIQEIVAVRSVRVPRWLDQSLGLLAYFYLGAAVILAATNTAFIICRFDPFVAMFRLSGSGPMLLFGGSILAIAAFVGRPYCRYLCPYGAMLRVISRCSKWQVRIPPTECINCHLCEDACPYDAIRTPSVASTASAASTDHERRSGKLRLIGVLAGAPILIVASAGLASLLGEPLARWAPEVQLAEQLRAEELGLAAETTDATDAFRTEGGSREEAYATAIQWRKQCRVLAMWLGGWVGLVVAAKLIQLSLFRRRTEYQPDQSGCVACGRCFWYCPVEQVRLGLIEDVSEVAPEAMQ